MTTLEFFAMSVWVFPLPLCLRGTIWNTINSRDFEAKIQTFLPLGKDSFSVIRFLKLVWLALQPLFYALRPTLTRPKTPRPLDIANTVCIVVSDLIICYLCGPRGVLYLVISTLLGMGIHPVAGHFIAEHYVFVEPFETYSYYGILNYFCWNVGYHNEHHDFPRVPGWRLPQVKAMAPEFYDNLPSHKSWVYVLYRYVTDPTICPFSRAIREEKKSE